MTWFRVALVSALALVVALPAGANPPLKTSLDDYLARDEPAYRWSIVSDETTGGVRTVIVELVSQTWLTTNEVDRVDWTHHMVVTIPPEVTTSTGMVFVSGGSNGRGLPGANLLLGSVALNTGSIITELRQVPNQPLQFHGDGVNRWEDDLIGYTWDQFLKGGDDVWLARNAMVKSVVKAMDAITELAEEVGGWTVDRYVVAGASKRGWTTWLTGALDDRVVAIAPIVIDVLNTQASMRHHFEAYGFWAPSIGDYVRHGIMERFDDPRLDALYELVDPIHYRHRLTMPKLILNAAGDQFFLPDSSQFYRQSLRGETYLRYVANADHSMDGSDAVATLSAFHSLIVRGVKPPSIEWSTVADDRGRLTLRTFASEPPVDVKLWQAANPRARDFRVETLGPAYRSTLLDASEPGWYVASIKPPKKGWSASFLEFTFDVGATTPLKLTTDVFVLPDVLPFAGKPLDRPASVTLVCRGDVDEAGLAAVDDAAARRREGDELFLHWQDTSQFVAVMDETQKTLAAAGCEGINIQLESGGDVTLPPR